MDIDSAISARYAEYGPDGTLVLVGAGLSGVMSQPLPTAMPQPGGVAAVGTPVYFFVAVRVTFDRSPDADRRPVRSPGRAARHAVSRELRLRAAGLWAVHGFGFAERRRAKA